MRAQHLGFQQLSYLVGLVGTELLVELARNMLTLKGRAANLLGELIPLRTLARGILTLAVASSHGSGGC